MNKKGGPFLQFIANAAIVVALIYFIFIMIFGVGGGFTAVFKAGSFLGSLPGWAIAGIVLFFLYLLAGGKKK